MTLKALVGRKWLHGVALSGAAVAGYVFGITADRATAQPAGGLPPPDKRVVAYIYGNVPVTREELGDFLIARGGYEKLDLLVNKKIIEVEAVRRNIAVTSDEVLAGFNEDLRGLGINKADFEKHVLPRYGKTLYEWSEDVIKPRILLGKMCRDRVKVTEEDLKKSFENRHGEKRQAKIICWNKDDLRAAQKQWDEARKGDVEFDRVARMQADPNLAASCGLVAPVGRFVDAESSKVEEVLFSLKTGELSQLFETPAGIMCVKCVAILPPDTTVSFDKLRPSIEKDVWDKKLTAEIPKFFGDLKKQAQPNVLLKGPPSPKEFRDGVTAGVNQLINQAGGVPPGTKPMPK